MDGKKILNWLKLKVFPRMDVEIEILERKFSCNYQIFIGDEFWNLGSTHEWALRFSHLLKF